MAEEGWQAALALEARRDGDRTLLHAEHRGPLRVLKALYPENPAICHAVLVHPPAGIVGGDRLRVDAAVGSEAHLVVTTPGATRFYRSDGASAEQTAQAQLSAGSRLEWLPLETLVYDGALARNRQCFVLGDGAEMIGWDLLALGLPAAGSPFERGCYEQHIELPGLWLERARIAAADKRLLDSPLGLAGHRVLGTLWWASGPHGNAERRAAQAVEAARGVIDAAALTAAATSLGGRSVVVRLLGDGTEAALRLMRDVRLAWREQLWGLPRVEPRVWAT